MPTSDRRPPPAAASVWTTRRKNSCPVGSSIRCESGLSSAVVTGRPSRYQVTVGAGSPSAWQLSVAGSLRATYTSSGCSTMRGLLAPGPPPSSSAFFEQICLPENCLHDLLPPERDPTLSARPPDGLIFVYVLFCV